MRTFFYLLVFFFFYTSCNNKHELTDDKTAELKDHFLNQYKAIDEKARVDSFSVLRIDTITEQNKYASLAFDFMGEWQKQNELLELENTLLQKRIGLMQLTKGQPENAANEEEARQSLDTISAINGRIDIAKNKMTRYDSLSKKADSLKPIGYEAVCVYRIQKPDWTQEVDTAYITMDKNYKIVERQIIYRE